MIASLTAAGYAGWALFDLGPERRANDKDLEIMVGEMKQRAERKFGELSQKLDTSKGGRPKNRGNAAPISTPTKKQVLAEVGVDKRHANRCEKLADIPEEGGLRN